MLDLQQLEVLRAVDRTGSLTAAAARLGLSQSTVSHHLARLEAAAGLELTVRRRRGAVLTEAGEGLLRHGEAVLDRLALAAAELEDRRTSRAGSYLVSSYPSAHFDLLPTAIRTILASRPEIRFELAVGTREESLAALAAGDANMALTFTAASDPSFPAGLARTELLADPMMVILPRAHPLAAGPEVHLRDLAEHRWIMSATGGPDALTWDALRSAGVDPDVLIETGDLQATYGLVAAGLGVALSPATTLRHARRDLAVRAVAGRPVVRTIEVFNRESDSRPLTAELLQALSVAADGFA